mgnify:CR=1 FL=1
MNQEWYDNEPRMIWLLLEQWLMNKKKNDNEQEPNNEWLWMMNKNKNEQWMMNKNDNDNEQEQNYGTMDDEQEDNDNEQEQNNGTMDDEQEQEW